MNPLIKIAAALFTLTVVAGCSTVYQVSDPIVTSAPATASDAAAQHPVTVTVVRKRIRTAGQILLEVKVVNNTAAELTFDTSMISATLANKTLTVLTYDERLRRVQAELNQANRYGGFNYGFFGQISRGGFGIGANIGDFDGFMDAADRQRAIDELDRVISRGLRPSKVAPGATLVGEVAFADNLNLDEMPNTTLEVVIKILAEKHVFKFAVDAS